MNLSVFLSFKKNREKRPSSSDSSIHKNNIKKYKPIGLLPEEI